MILLKTFFIQKKHVLFQSVSIFFFLNIFNVFLSNNLVFRYNKFEMLMVEIKSLHEINSLPKTRWNISQPADNDVHEDALTTGTLLMVLTVYHVL